MTRIIPKARRCLHVREWPAADQTLWHGALGMRSPEDETRSPAAAWTPGTIQTNREGYGRWINFLVRAGCDLADEPGARVTPARVRDYLAELRRQKLSIRTLCNRISQLLNVMLAIDPGRDWSWLNRRFRYLDVLANENRRQLPPTLLSGDILDASLKALDQFRGDGPVSDIAWAITYRNWLMVAMATLLALRRQNFANLSIERHTRWVGETWLIEIPAKETKGRRPISMPIPLVLHPHIRFYLEHARPLLLDGRTSDRLWITTRQTSMTAHSYYIAMTNFTRKVFGKAINPHRYRHIGATTITVGAPEKLDAARAFLSHSDSATTRDNYIIGQSVAASRNQAAMVARLRRTLPGAKHTNAATSEKQQTLVRESRT